MNDIFKPPPQLSWLLRSRWQVLERVFVPMKGARSALAKKKNFPIVLRML
jgi:hypothetical protein